MPIENNKEANQVILEQRQEIQRLKKLLEQEKLKFDKKLKETQSWYENLIALLPGHIYWLNGKNEFLGCNNEQAQSANLASRHEIVGKTNFDMPWKDQASELNKINNLVMQSGEPQVREEYATTIKGAKTYLSHKVPIHDENNKITGVLGVSLDISNIKALELKLREANTLAEAANRAKDEFLANMSHDIRTPLTGIIGISAMLEQEVQKIEEKEHAHWVNVSGEQLLALLNSVLDIVSTGDKREKHVKKVSVSINQLLHNIADLELPTIKLKQLELTVDVDNSVPEFVKTDHVKLHRILLNLLGNAIKFTDIGQIAIRVEYSPVNNKKGLLQLFVSDTGPGIAKDDQEKVFDRFYRSNPSYKGQYTGFGVGLHIVQQYVSLLKGTISLESQPGRGTTFKVSIPVEIAANPNKALPRTVPVHQAYNFAKENNIIPASTNTTAITTQSLDNLPLILLVEDNPIALKVAESIVKQAQGQYLSATTGESALELAKTHEFDLVLSDIGLPGISGNELATAIRSLETTLGKKNTPIIGLTAHTIKDTEQESFKAGMNKVISKPITLAILKSIINEFMPSEEKLTVKTNEFEKELPDSEAELFNLLRFPLLDITVGINTLGSVEILKELVMDMFHDDIPREVDAIKKAHSLQNWKEIERIAHKIKSGALYCGMVRMKHACQYLERYQKAGHSHLQAALYQQLILTIEHTNAAISEWIAST